jgi:hypothetical protein
MHIGILHDQSNHQAHLQIIPQMGSQSSTRPLQIKHGWANMHSVLCNEKTRSYLNATTFQMKSSPEFVGNSIVIDEVVVLRATYTQEIFNTMHDHPQQSILCYMYKYIRGFWMPPSERITSFF